MKQNYIKPSMVVVKIQVMQMLASSPDSIPVGDYSGGTVGASEFQDSGSSNEEW